MSDGIYTALSGAIAQQYALDVAANNAANVNTTGYRGDRPVFEEVLAKAGAGRAPDVLRWVQASDTATTRSEGISRATGNPLDIALHGDGFLVVQTANGERYTRAGSFFAGPGGELVTQDGDAVLGDSGPIVLPSRHATVSFGTDGSIKADGASAGKLKIVKIDADVPLRKEGGALLRLDADGFVPQQDDSTEVMQGYLEGSNVHAIGSVTEMVTVSRSFDAFQKIIQTYRQLDDRAARDIAGR